MPRAAATSVDIEVEKKTPRKRAAPKKPRATKAAVVAGDVPIKKPARKTPVKRKPAVRKKVAKKPVELETETETETELADIVDVEVVAVPTRKAPTPFSNEVAIKKSQRTQYIIIGVLLFVGVSASAAVGLHDSEAGQIDVAQTIKERTERMANMVTVDGPTIVAPRLNPNNEPDGGLIGIQSTPDPIPKTEQELAADAAMDAATASSTVDTLAPGVSTPITAVDSATTTVTAADVLTDTVVSE